LFLGHLARADHLERLRFRDGDPVVAGEVLVELAAARSTVRRSGTPVPVSGSGAMSLLSMRPARISWSSAMRASSFMVSPAMRATRGSRFIVKWFSSW
jgi:hypothetical protein